MKKWIMLGIVIAAASAAPMATATAAHKAAPRRVVITCQTATNTATAAFYTDNTPTPSGIFYVNTASPGLWQESNGKPGLQTTAHKGCWAADTQVTPAAPAAPSGPPSIPPGVSTVPSAPSVPGGLPSAPSVPGGVPTVPGGVPTVPSAPGAPGGLPAVPGGLPGLPLP